ncbi:MAG: lipase family protein [Pseudomonadota bacterium]
MQLSWVIDVPIHEESMNHSTIVAPTVTSRLACACNCAYGIGTHSGSYAPPAIYDPGVGWLAQPTPISAPEQGQPTGPRINACLVGRNGDGIVVAFRGTLPPAWTVASLEDWWQDIVDSEPIAKAPLPGKVHSGFLAALGTIFNAVVAEVRRLRADTPNAPILVTGHSKGGPLASIGAALLQLQEGIPVNAVVTFASPHPGDQDFVDGYPAAIPVTRYENYLDIVPLLPPTAGFYRVFKDVIPESLAQEFCSWFPGICKALENASNWNYAALGDLRYVTSHGAVVGATDPSANDATRIIEIVATLFGFGASRDALEAASHEANLAMSESGLAAIGAAHCIACRCTDPKKPCAGGYMTGAGGDSICPGN